MASGSRWNSPFSASNSAYRLSLPCSTSIAGVGAEEVVPGAQVGAAHDQVAIEGRRRRRRARRSSAGSGCRCPRSGRASRPGPARFASVGRVSSRFPATRSTFFRRRRPSARWKLRKWIEPSRTSIRLNFAGNRPFTSRRHWPSPATPVCRSASVGPATKFSCGCSSTISPTNFPLQQRVPEDRDVDERRFEERHRHAAAALVQLDVVDLVRAAVERDVDVADAALVARVLRDQVVQVRSGSRSAGPAAAATRRIASASKANMEFRLRRPR